MLSRLDRVDIIPSDQWTVVGADGRLVWAHYTDDGLIATYWEVRGEPTASYCLVRTDTLPDQHSINPSPGQIVTPYWPKSVGMDGAYPFINSEVFLWVANIGPLPDYGIEGLTPTVTYQLNQNLTPPAT